MLRVFRHIPVQILGVAVLFTLAGLGLVCMMGKVFSHAHLFPYWVDGLLVGFWLIYFVTLIGIVAHSLRFGILNRPRSDFALIVFSLYIAHSLCFASGYLTCSLVIDLKHWERVFNHYETYKERFGNNFSFIYTGNHYALAGLQHRMWVPNDVYVGAVDEDCDYVDVEQLVRWTSENNVDDFVHFEANHVLPAFAEHLYFSVVTVTTLGYGDVAPNSMFTKYLSILQVLSGLTLLVFVFKSRRNEDNASA